MDDREADTDAVDSLSLDTIYELLADERRRNAIAFLREHEALTLPDLADEIACREYDRPITEIPEEKVLHVYSSLWHTHVPKLAEANVVAYDQDRDIVTLAENAEEIERVASFDVSVSEE